uniref:uncharacterized protein LOC122597301 n=1 Tax=Erigeron canadensis TaxID=72917 RepID=UPI001CB91A23|nr:uncharacterized protein LOC122597301 [Erigeron canadensis]
MGDNNASPSVKETNILSFQCPMLKSTNYAIWSLRMEVIIGIHGIWKVVSPCLVDAKMNNMVKALLFQSIPEDLILQIGQLKTGKEMWEAIKTQNLGVERIQNNNTIDDFAAKFSRIASKSASLREVIPEQRLVKKFLTSLPKRFLQFVASLEQVLDLKKIGYEDVVGRLKAYEEKIKEDDNENGTQRKLFFSKAQSSNKNRDSNKGKSCGLNIRDPGRVRGQRDLSTNLNVIQEGDTDYEEGTLFMMNRFQEKIYLNEDKFIPPKIETRTDDDDIWYFDNGVSNHMTGNRSYFSELNKLITRKVKFGDGSGVDINLFEGKSGERKLVKDVYYIPSLQSNVISLGQATITGCDIRLQGDFLTMRDKSGRLFMEVSRSGNRLYKTRLRVAKPQRDCVENKQVIVEHIFGDKQKVDPVIRPWRVQGSNVQ